MSVEFALGDLVYGEVYPCGFPNRLPEYEVGSFVALDSKTGKRRWDHDVTGLYGGASRLGDNPDGYAGVVGVGSEAVVVEGANGSLQALEPRTGKLLWERPFGSSSVVGGNRELVVLGTADATAKPRAVGSVQVDALDRRTGRHRWTWRPPDGWSAPHLVVGESAIVAATFDRVALSNDPPVEVALRMIDPRSGQERWQLPGALELLYERRVAVIGSVVVVDEPTGMIRGYEIANGREVWANDPDVREADLVSSHPPLLVSPRNGGVMRLDPADGSLRWKASPRAGVGPLAVGKYLVLFSSRARLRGIDARTGRTRWKRPTVRKGVQSAAIGQERVVLAGGCDLSE